MEPPSSPAAATADKARGAAHPRLVAMGRRAFHIAPRRLAARTQQNAGRSWKRDGNDRAQPGEKRDVVLERTSKRAHLLWTSLIPSTTRRSHKEPLSGLRPTSVVFRGLTLKRARVGGLRA